MTTPLWAVGSYLDRDGLRVPWRISHDEINRDVGRATTVLGDLGIAGRGVLWCSMLSEAGQFWPYVCGTVLAGGKLSCADATAGEAMRVAMFLRLMPYDGVFGVTPAILDGLAESGHDLHEVFGRVRLLGACPGAYERLAAAGLAPVRFALCGPAVVIGGGPGAPARPTPAWHLDSDGDGVYVTARESRAQEFRRTPVGAVGTIEDGGLMW